MNSTQINELCYALQARRERVRRMQMDYEMHVDLWRNIPTIAGEEELYGLVAEAIPVTVHLTSVGGSWAYDGFSYQTTRVDKTAQNRIVYETIKATGVYPLDKVIEDEIKKRLNTPRTHMDVDFEWRIAKAKEEREVHG